jgi:co-chaperonin GroES (HSP10)
MIKPFGDNILIELQSSYKKALVTDDRMGETKKQGLCVAVPTTYMPTSSKMDSFPTINRNYEILLNKVVYFDEFEATTQYTIDGKKYALIEIKNIRGYEDE